MQRAHDWDVIVLGAGAAGLSAAQLLSRNDYSVLLLEARERIGGRIHTLSDPALPIPVELGAEFIHGEAPALFELLQLAGISATDTAGTRWTLRGDHLIPREHLFDDVRALMQRVDALEENDLSVADFLARYAGDPRLERARSYVRMMVEGFDAADTRDASIRAIAREWSGSGFGGQYRPVGGYAALMAYLFRVLDPKRAQLKLGSTVQSVQWRRGHVSVEAASDSGPLMASARCALVTLPVGVLQLPPGARDAVRFEPQLTEKREALQRLASGGVIKVVLQFRRAFWEELHGGAYADAGFLHAPEADFPTLWTALPRRVPFLTAWCGGPNAARLAGKERVEIIDRALRSIEALFGDAAPVRRELTAAHVHDWQADPLSHGAYTYVKVGGEKASEQLAAPLANTLFFAGEAASSEEMGTVEAAVQSGRRAAREIIAGLGG
ncbi:MAG TPA: NAD(P)/FAD-dependent oxidoreductase [Steroidobacteraceae bacterium]|nr:NAD(P)/FAD-dependent oxidoreductase [Steroidobacteraceae bacterium]